MREFKVVVRFSAGQSRIIKADSGSAAAYKFYSMIGGLNHGYETKGIHGGLSIVVYHDVEDGDNFDQVVDFEIEIRELDQMANDNFDKFIEDNT